MLEIHEIGIVKSKFSEADDPFKMKKELSILIIHEQYEEALYKIEEDCEYLQILFYFHKSDKENMFFTNI